MNSVKPKVAACYSEFKVQGMAMVNVVIGKNGKVSSATVSGKFAGTPTGACVEKAVKSASFPPSDGLRRRTRSSSSRSAGRGLSPTSGRHRRQSDARLAGGAGASAG